MGLNGGEGFGKKGGEDVEKWGGGMRENEGEGACGVREEASSSAVREGLRSADCSDTLSTMDHHSECYTRPDHVASCSCCRAPGDQLQGI